jgi:hypothetical protein
VIRVRVVRPLFSVAALLAFVVALAAPAGAQAAPGTTYKASAKATGLDLQVLGQGVTLGLSQTDVSSDPKANATGIGLALPGIGNQNQIDASSGSDGQTTGTPAPGTCGPLTLPPSVPVIDLSTACSSSTASIADGLPSSVSTADVADLKLNAADLLKQLPLSQITSNVQPVLDQLKTVFTQLDTTGIDGNSLISSLMDALNQSGELVHIDLGPTQAESKAVNADSANVVGTATAQGAVIDLLPRDALNLAPVATITLGASSNTISVDRNTGAATVNFDPSLVKITLADDILAALGPAGAPFASGVTVAPGQSMCLPLPDPLTSCITVGGGSQTKLPDGTTHAEAAGVSLDLLKGLPQGGVSLSLAKTTVEGIAVAAPAAAPAPAPEQGLARTGGSTDAALVGALLAIAFAGYLLSRSSRRRRELELR